MTEVASIRVQLVALKPGQSYAEAVKLNPDAVNRTKIRHTLRKLSDRVNASVARAKAETGSNFVTNTGSFLTATTHDLILSVVVTRES